MAHAVGEIESIGDLLKDANRSYLKVLAKPKAPLKAEVDIVAVHGLRIPFHLSPWKDEHAFGVKTWIDGDPGEEVLWLKDFLPKRITVARVLLFGYNSNIGLDTSTAGVTGAADDLLAKLKNRRKDDPNRPIVFLCHSLGGIVVKHAISKARSSPRYNEILYEHVRAIAFFATPHRGGFGAHIGQIIAGALRRFSGNVRSSIIEALREDSLISSDIHRYFLDSLKAANIHVCSFYETKPMALLHQLVVDQNSAVLGLTDPEEVVCLVPEANHSSICKFKDETENYDLVISHIQDLVDWALSSSNMPSLHNAASLSTTSLSQSFDDDNFASNVNLGVTYLAAPSSVFSIIRPSTPNLALPPQRTSRGETSSVQGPFYLLPDKNTANFSGRASIMNRIKEAISASQNQHIRIVLYGLGGVGKTQIALRVASWYQEKYPSHSIFWLRGGSAVALLQSFSDIAIMCGLVKKEEGGILPLEEIHHFLLNEENGKWLMILDNADSTDTFNSVVYGTQSQRTVSLATLLPKAAHGKLLITTQSKIIGAKLAFSNRNVMELGPMDQQDSLKLLKQQLFEPAGLDVETINPPDYEKEIPTDIDIEKLADLLGHLPLILTQAAAFLRQQGLSVTEYVRLLDKNKEAGLSVFFDGDFTSYNVNGPGDENDFSRAVASTWNVAFDQIEKDSPTAASLLSLMAFLDPDEIPMSLMRSFDIDEWRLEAKSLGALQAYALVSPLPGGKFKMHRMVQLAIKKRLASHDTARTWASIALKLLADNFPKKELQTSATLLPHASQVLKNDFEDTAENKLNASILASKISWYYNSWGQLIDSENLSQQAWEYLKSVPKAPKEVVLNVQATRTMAFRDTGRLKEAEDLAKEVLAGRRKLLGETDADTVDSYNTLTVIYQDQGYFKKAANIARGTLKALQKRLKADNIRVLRVKARLGWLLHCLGKDKEAEVLLMEAYDGYVQTLGKNEHLTLKVVWNLAMVLFSQAKYKESMEVSLETWKAQKTAFGENHPQRFKSLALIARNLQAQSQFEQALIYLRKIHIRGITLLGSYHRHSLTAASYLASCLLASAHGKEAFEAYTEAESLYRAILAGTRQQLRNDHPEMLAAQTGLATTLRLRFEYVEAEKMQREVLKKLKGELGKAHPLFLDGEENLARILWEMGEEKSMKEGRKLAKSVLGKRERDLGWNHPDTRRMVGLVVEMLPAGKEREREGERLKARVGETDDTDVKFSVEGIEDLLLGEDLPPGKSGKT